MTVTIGRVAGVEMVDRPDINGDRMTFSGFVDCASTIERDVTTLNLRALAGDRLGPVPVRWSETSRWDAFYRVLDVAVEPWHDTDPVVLVQVELERLSRSPELPVIEQTVSSSIRDSDAPVSSVNVDAAVWFPDAATFDTEVVSPVSVSTEDGLLLRHPHANPPPALQQVMYALPMASFYVGAPRIEWRPTTTSTSWYRVDGLSLPPSASPRQVRWSNGLVRFTPSTGSAIQCEIWSAGSWKTMQGTIGVQRASFGPTTDPAIVDGRPPVILRNDSTVALRFFGEKSVFDVSLQRGHYHTECSIRWAVPQATYAGMYVEAVGSGSGANRVISGQSMGVYRSSADANNIQWAIYSVHSGYDGANGVIKTGSSVRPSDFCIGLGASGTVYWDLAYWYWASLSTSERVVG